MADPGNHSRASELSPEQLDRLEDALERWTAEELEPVPEDSLLEPTLRARLDDYRELLAMTRAELPMEDVADGLLAGVLAEAHQSARTTTPPRREAVAGPSLWERLRRSMLLPGVALAGTAAMLLWVVQPGDAGDNEDAAPLLAERASETVPGSAAQLSPDARPSPAAAREPEGLAAPEQAFADKEAEKQDPADAMAAGGAAPAARADAPAPELRPAETKASGVKAKKKPSEELAPPPSYPGLDDAPPADADKEALRDTLELADTARRKGRCSEALGLYLDAMGMSGAASERARARAGYGLCLMTQGDDRAEKYFEAAHKEWPGIDGWIQRERGDGPSKKAAHKPSPRSKAEAADSPLD